MAFETQVLSSDTHNNVAGSNPVDGITTRPLLMIRSPMKTQIIKKPLKTFGNRCPFGQKDILLIWIYD